MYPLRDSNSHTSRRRLLRPTCLPFQQEGIHILWARGRIRTDDIRITLFLLTRQMELTTVPLWHYLLHKWDSNPQPSPFRRRCSIPFKLPCTTTCTSLSFCYPNRTRTCDLFHVKEVLLSQLSYRAICVVLTGFEPMFTLRPDRKSVV